ncbi:MutS domain-containing III family protein [Cryptosporidium serpentis]
MVKQNMKNTGNPNNGYQSSILSFFTPSRKGEITTKKNTLQTMDYEMDSSSRSLTPQINMQNNVEVSSCVKRLDNLELFSAERSIPTTCETTPTTSTSVKLNPINSSGRRIRKICDDDDDEFLIKKICKQSCLYKEDNEINRGTADLDDLLYEMNDEESNELIFDSSIKTNEYSKLGMNLPDIKAPNKDLPKNIDIERDDFNEDEEVAKKLLSTTVAQGSQFFREYVELIVQYGRQFSFPSWLQLRKIKDSNGRYPTDPNYNPSTVWVPDLNSKITKEEKCHFTPAMQQYWELKKDHFDKLVFFKIGKFYELFYIDACLSQRLCDLRWMSGDGKPHVGFPEAALHAYANKLVNYGYRVVVVEQMETPKELEERNRTTSGIKKDKAVRRGVNEFFTNGTLVRPNMLNDMARILMTIYLFSKVNDETPDNIISEIGIVCVDITTGKSELSILKEIGDHFPMVKTLVAQVQPREVVYLSGNLPLPILRYLKNITPTIQLTSFRDFTEPILASKDIIEHFQRVNVEIPTIINELCTKSTALCTALSGTLNYLKSILLCDRFILTGDFQQYNPDEKQYLLLDAGALKDLELLQTQQGDEKNSLFGFLKHTSTPGGTRLLRKWLSHPLTNAPRINERLDCVEWFINHSDVLFNFCRELKAISSSNGSGSPGLNLDLERIINRITTGALQNTRGAIFFVNVIQKKIVDFLNSLEIFEKVLKCIKSNFEDIELRKSMPTLLLALTGVNNLQSEEKVIDEPCLGGFLPEISGIIEILRSWFVKDINNEWIPASGNYDLYDLNLSLINETKDKLNAELELISSKLNSTTIKFVHMKYRYEVECPDNIPRSKLPKLEITSSKKGFIRFHTDKIKDLIYELEYREEQLQNSLFPYIQEACKMFHSHFSSFSAISDALSQLDVLIALSIVSMDTSDGPFCRPTFLEDSGKSVLELTKCRHPVVARLNSGFVDNDIFFNAGDVHASCILVTGPNMGGKSTVLRQTCIAVIMAHIGCFVPASKCFLTLVDRIFTRIGAYDSILEAKSTFLVELEETATILKYATKNSLVVVDELGRGTSTFDGTAICVATLEYISHHIQCRCLFSTHLHLLCQEFGEDPSITAFHMDLKLSQDTKTITFLYKFVRGICPKSYGMNVAQLAGIPAEVVDSAANLASEVEHCTNILRHIAYVRVLLLNIMDLDPCEAYKLLSSKENKLYEDLSNCFQHQIVV